MAHPPDSESLRALLDSIEPLPVAEWRWLEAGLRGRSFEAGEALLRAGAAAGEIHFLCAGLVRYFYLAEDGAERNHTFAGEGSLVGCFPVLAGADACPFTVEALEPVETLQIAAETIRRFRTRHPCWMALWGRLAEHVALRKTSREESFLMESAEQRYRRFLAEHADLAPRIPQYHIASWLGITPVALSRIRRRINPG